MTRRLVALLTAMALGTSGALAGCATDDAVEKDAKKAAQDADRAAGNNDEKAKDAGEDAVDAVDDDDGK